MSANSVEVIKENLLPSDGIVEYYGLIIDAYTADNCFNSLLEEIVWRQDELIMFGRRRITKRKVAWYGSKPYPYTYSGVTKTALPWTTTLLKLKKQVENVSSETYNSCLLNLYQNGREGMGWHSDDEKALKKNGAIASLSLGAERRFLLKHKQKQTKVEVFLEHGSLLVMRGETQDFWVHRLPQSTKVTTPRINLTFRTIYSVSDFPLTD